MNGEKGRTHVINRLLGRWTVAIVLVVLAVAYARSQPAETSPPASARAAAPRTVSVLATDAGETREELRQLLLRYPPELARVLKLDPTLMANESYMAAYPQLGAFLVQHPEVLRSADYFLNGVRTPVEQSPDAAAIQLWQTVMDYGSMLLVFGVVTIVLVWLVKTILEQRRWARLSRVQTDVHSKLLDRFSSNEDLLAYMQTSPGRRFLEAAPIPIDAAPSRGMGAPVSRILWSIHAGVILSALGVGLQLVRGHVAPVIAAPLLIMSVVALSIGVGFVVSAIVSYVLSRRLGLFETPSPPLGGREAGSSLG
jgi:hypothetical protein